MYFNSENILLVGSVLIFLSILISKTGYKFGVPTLLLFLLVGMLFGSDGLGVQFSGVGQAQFIGMVALSIILFSGGMETSFKEIKPVLGQGIMLSTVGVLLTTGFTGLFIWFLSGWTSADIRLPLLTSMLLAATMSSTDSASVFSLLRSQKINLKYKLRPTLELESGSNDPMAYLLTIVLIQVIGLDGGLSAGGIIMKFLSQFIFGGVVGFLVAKGAIWVVNKIKLPNAALYPILMLCVVFITFALADVIGGNGYLAVYVAGILVGNSKVDFRKEIVTFMNGLTWLFQIVMFLALGLLVNPHEMKDVWVVGLLVGVFMILVARPLTVFLCMLPFGKSLPRKAQMFVSWVGLRGAVPIMFATYPVLAGIEGSGQIFNIVFFITLLSLAIQGTTIAPVARKLGLEAPFDETPEHFGVEVPEELGSGLNDMDVTEEMLSGGKRLADMKLPQGTLVMLVKRGSDFIVPNGQVELRPGDKLLLISEKKG